MGKTPKQEEQSQREEAVRLKTLAEKKFNSSDLHSALKYAKRAHRLCPAVNGLAEMVTAFRILRSVADAPPDSDPNWYEILDLEPFSHINSIRNQYKKLALILHPDKSSLEASGEAFKLVNDAFHVLSDRVRRKEYDMKLRVAIQAAAAAEEVQDEAAGDTFSTRCSRCRLLHKFNRKYTGQSLVCPSCRKSFTAVEVSTETLGEMKTNLGLKRKMSSVDDVLQRSDRKSKNVAGKEKPKIINERAKVTGQGPGKAKPGKEMTLAEMRVELRKKSGEKKKAKTGEDNKKKEERISTLKSGDMEVMKVEDSDFYDFDRDRVERSFKQGQVWAIYDDDDGMPRHYGLIEEVLLVNPFEVKMSWLDLQNNGDESLICWEKMGFHVSCGRFKVSKKDTINLVNVFSHMVKCERVARELYRIFPHKGSVWALYNLEELEIGGRNSSAQENRHYKIVVFLTSYHEMYGISMAYLKKVDGFRTVFKRMETGPNAVRWLEKYDFRCFSHQIPARELCGDDVPDHLNNCWELDPAALPPDLLAVTPAP